MKKIAFIGAGSFGFTRDLVKDILTFPAFADAHISLMDIDDERLRYISRAVQAIIDAGHYPATMSITKNRREALEGADGVLITVLSGDVDVWQYDIEIPKQFGVDINVGDTRGPSGIFRYLRTAPLLVDICTDVEKYCPNAIVLNYTNPMAMLCRTVQEMTGANVTGLCHSVQGTAMMLARWIGADYDTEVSYLCAGINHQAFYLQYEVNGKDAYPAIREALKRPEIYNEEIVRNEMFKYLDYYVTESSGHNSEYNAWFRKRPDLIEKYCTNGTGWNPGVYAYIRDEYAARKNTWRGDIEKMLATEIDLIRGKEYAASIFNAIFGDNTPFDFNGNVRNDGLIENLPSGCCVEVPVTASCKGLVPHKVGSLPDHLAVLVNTSARCEELAVKGFINHNRRDIFHAILFDPLTSAVLSMEEIHNMVDHMYAKNKEYLSYME